MGGFWPDICPAPVVISPVSLLVHMAPNSLPLAAAYPRSEGFRRRRRRAMEVETRAGQHAFPGMLRGGSCGDDAVRLRLAEVAVENSLATVTASAFDRLVTHGAQTV